MNQRSTFSRTKEPRREKIIRTRRDDGERILGDEPPTRRSSSERPNPTHVSSYSRYKDSYSEKSRSNSRDSQGSLIFRRQERNKLQSNYAKGSSGEISPSRVSHADTMRNETSGRLNYVSHYNRGFNIRERDYPSKRSGLIDNNHTIDEDRLKSFLRRLLRDDDRERQASLIRQLKIAFEHPENYEVVVTNRDAIISTFEDFVQLGLNAELKHEFTCAVGTLGAMLGNKAKCLLDWEFTIINTSKCEDLRILMLKTLLEMLKIDSEKQSLSELIPFVMSRLQSTLEVADIPELLIAIVNVIFEISSGYPAVFSNHFSDIVDILIGWHIDASQQQSVIDFTSNALINFQQFWISDTNFTVTLLGQFLEDMESYAEGLPKIKSPSKKSVMYLKELAQSKLNSTGNSETVSCPAENIAKIKSLIRVLITVLKSIENLITPEENGLMTWRFVIEMLKNFLKYVTKTVEYSYYCDLMTSANECLDLILKLAQSHSKDALDELMSYMDLLQSRNCNLYESHLISILKVMIRFVKSVGTYLPVKFVTKLFSTPSLTRQLKLSPSSSIQKLLMELYHVVLDVKNVRIVEEFYKCILVDIMEAHSVLLKSSNESLVDMSKVKNSEATLLLSICTLVEIGNIKHSLIRMFALKPSFFELMTCHLKPTAPDLAKKYPALQSSILYIVYSHSQRHSHFVNSSVLINPNAASGSPVSTSGHNSPIMTDIPPASPSSGNLGEIIKLLIDLLENQYHSYDSRLLAARWTNEILESIQRHISRLMTNSQFLDLLGAIINAGLTCDTTICKACCKSLHLFLKSAAPVLPLSTLQRCYDLCIIRLSSHDPELQDQFATLLPLLPLDIILTASSVNVPKSSHLFSGTKDIEVSSKGCSSISDIWALYRGYMSRSYAGNFFSHHFRGITNFVLLGKEPQEKKWLLRLFHSCPPPERYSKVDSLFIQLANNSIAALWFWAMWEIAQFCVSYKLRTPLGKPQETFMAIEAALKSAAKSTKNNDDSFLSESRYTTLFRVNLLLSLMENLEKLMYNAYEGCAVALPSPPKIVRTFFRTNKSTCHEWLSRVRATAITVSLNAGCYAAAVRHGFELLQELKNSGNTQGAEFDSALYSVVKALIHLHCPDAVLGLYIWCKEKIGRKLTWIKASVDCAAGRFENASAEYLCVLHSLSENMSPLKKNKHTEEIKSSEKQNSESNSNEQLNKTDVNSSKPVVDIHLHTFLINQVIECYMNVQNWSEASNWAEFLEKVKLNQNGITLPKPWCSNNLTYLKCLSSFEESSVMFSKKDINSFKSDLTRNSEFLDISSWNMVEQFSKAQRLLISVAIDYDNKNRSSENMQDLSEHIHDARDRILKLMKLSTLNWPPQIDSKLAGLFVSTSLFQTSKKAPSVQLRENIKLDPTDCYGSTLGFLLTWENVWLSLNPSFPTKFQNGYFDLLMTSIRLARKQQNFKMCYKLISKSLNYLSKTSQSNEINSLNTNSDCVKTMTDSLKNMMKSTFHWSINEKLLRTQREGAKLLRCFGENENSSDILLHSVCLTSRHLKDSSSFLQSYTVEQLSELNSRSMLNLVKYVQQDAKIITASLDNSSKENNWNMMLYNFVNDLKQSKEITGLNKNFDNELEQEKVVSDSDYLIGQLLQLSIYQCPTLAKSWYNFASWCYGWGRKVVNTSCVSMNMLPEEKSKITSLVPNASPEDINSLVNAVLNLHTSTAGEWDGQEMDYSENSIVEMKFKLITCCPFLLKIENSETIIDSILEVWKNLTRRAYSYYRMAAMSYLQYLQLNAKASNRDRSEDDNVTATLRLLRLVVKHALELRDVLEEGLAETPTAPWRGIIPQLFSRLNHPEPYVRQSISDLLCRVAQAAPHLIVFPAVVGSLTLKVGPELQEEAAGLFRVCLPDTAEDTTESQVEGSQVSIQEDLHPSDAILSDDDSEEDRQKTAVMQNCFTALVETLGSQDERTISEAKNLIHELHRITLLWDELWLGTLNLHQSEVNRRFSNLEKEICKVMNNTYLNKEEKKEIIKEKHNVYVKPTLFLLEQLQTITSQPAETPHEQWFQKTFEKRIEDAMNKLKNPSDPSRPQESWSVFKQLYQLLQQKVQQQSRSHLSMEHISPVLASLKNTVIPMPGINKPSGVVTIQSVHHIVYILPTKTKPKKLAFIGSDGHRYTYLFKGLEDLHLDERIMQFLSIVNNMFLKSKRHTKEVFYARHYSVTPLGPRSGLIQWVDGATPLFGLYKRWQQREANSHALKGQSSGANVGTVLRPSEIYYNKLTPLLKEKNLNCLDNRKEWPLSVMLEVLKQLMEETPDNLLAKELWCSCSSALEWWNITQTYNHSTAVMSIIGYIIGLGDRHLDNVLVDLATGEVVHIDYNVCFEKGKNLRVPEKVPFRMTPNIMTALGLTGIEGIFRTSCEHVLKVLRRGKETLLTLLEAFVYDPLVDWTPGNEGGYTGAVYGGRQAWATEAKQTRQSMELEIAFSMFAIRIAEMKGEWLKNRDELLAAFPKLEVLLQDWKNAQLNLQQTETELQDACQEKALLEEALLNPSHNLYTLPKRHDETTIVKTTVNATKEAVTEKLNECKKWHSLHHESLNTVCGSELGKWCADVSNDQNTDTLSVAAVVEFLQSAGQGQLVQQCEHAESELGSAVQQRRMSTRNCIDLLTTYATIVLQFGPGYKEQNRCFKWQKWLESLLSEFTSLKCIEILSDFRNHYGRESSDAIQSAVSLNVQFQTVISDINTEVLAILERMRIESLDDKQALITYAEETKCSVLHFLSEAGKPSYLAFLCVFGEALCAIKKQLFMMETAAGASGDRLVDLTSWNGDWFLDELYSTCGNIAQYIQLLMDSCVIESPELKSDLQGVKLAHFVFSALEDLCLHFQNIILPEAIQTALEPSVIEMVAKLDRIIARCGVPLEKLISDLETNITNLILKSQISESRVSDTVKKLRNEFESLMQRTEPQITGLNQGQMLLMGFNGLFTKIDSDLEVLLTYLDNLHIPPSWQKLDMYRDTVALAPPVHHHAARPILKDIYFVRKLSAMQQSFHACHSFAASLQINPRVGIMEREVVLMSEHQLVKPVKQFTADYVRHLVLGLPSQTIGFALCLLITHMGYDLTAEIELRDVGVENKVSLDEILMKFFKLCIADNRLENQLPSLSTLFSAFDGAWRKEDLSRRMEQHLLVARGSQQRAQLQLARFQWLNEDLLVQGNIGLLQTSSVPSRATVMSEIRKTVSTLSAFDCVVSSAHERYLNLTSGIEQRLKWAAGANPSLTAVQEEFEAAIAAKTSIINHTNQLSHELANVCNAILHFEALRTRTSEAVSSDNSFLSLINRCKETCELAESCQSQICPIEEHLISLKPLDKEGVTADWLTSIIKKVSQTLTTCREKLEHQKSVTTVCWESLHLQVVSVHEVISLHHKLMSEVRHILRNLAKHEELGLGVESKSEGQIHRYMALYKDFSERISAIISKIAEAQEMELASLTAIENELPVLSVSAAEVYNQLLELAGPLGNHKNGISETDNARKGHPKRNLLCPNHDSSVMHSPGVRPKTPMRYGTPQKLPIMRDPRTGKAVQERNTYATNVWKRVKMKLDGRDPESNKKSSISEQVDYVIKEATNLENLAVLYEGWTPWV